MDEDLLSIAELGDVPTCDLHGLSSADALHALELFIHHALMDHASVVRIIYGVGTGTLRRVVIDWLDREQGGQFIKSYRVSLAPRDSGAAVLVALHSLKPR